MTRPQDELLDLIRGELEGPASQGAHALAHHLAAEHGPAVQAILFYGSCLRSQDDHEGLLDFYVLIDSYRNLGGPWYWRLMNAVLPPNVFFLEKGEGARVLRAKYSVVSLADFARACTPRTFHPYFWARFAQPCALVYARDPDAVERITHALADAVTTFVRRSLPLVNGRVRVGDLWKRGLAESYLSEVRAERTGAPNRVVDADLARYERVGGAALARLAENALVEQRAGEAWVTPRASAADRFVRRTWPLRRAHGKLLSLLRILKGALTFAGGPEYALWKIERHSGVRVDPGWRERRLPWLALGAEFVRLYRKHAFR